MPKKEIEVKKKEIEGEKKEREGLEKKPKDITKEISKEIIQLKEQIKEKEQGINELTELLQRTQANLENYRKQTEKRIQEIQNQANKDLIIQLLPILDNFELALKNINNPEDFIKGIELIYSQILAILEGSGLKPIKVENQIFDPYKHEALLKMDSNQPEKTVLEVFQKGYLLNDEVIRHAKVKISSGKNDKPDEQNNQVLDKQNDQKMSITDKEGTENVK